MARRRLHCGGQKDSYKPVWYGCGMSGSSRTTEEKAQHTLCPLPTMWEFMRTPPVYSFSWALLFMGITYSSPHFERFYKVILLTDLTKVMQNSHFLFWEGRQGEGPLIRKRVVISYNENEFHVPHHPTPSAPLWSQATCYSYRIFIDVYTHAYISDWLTIINYLYVSVLHTVEGKYKKEKY